MATIKRGINREQESHFGLYRTSAGGDQVIIVRRKVGEPSDYMHKNSRKLARQRELLAQASQHYSHLTPSQKGITRHQFKEVEYQKSHGKTDTKILTGRELFIANEIRSLTGTQKQLVLPYELCIMLVDESFNPLDGELWLYCMVSGEWFDLPKAEIGKGSWLFSKVPPGYAPYRVYGEAIGFFDPLLDEHQAMTEDDIKPYHYHHLHIPVDFEYIHPNGDTGWIDLLPDELPHWVLVESEDTIFIPSGGAPGWGKFKGNYVWKNWYPWGERADLYYFTNPLWAAQYITKLIVHCKVQRDEYPYGEARAVLRTHGQTYYRGEPEGTTGWLWIHAEFDQNPYTNNIWTRNEVIAVQAGIAMDKVGSFGNIACDLVKVELRY
ncbi:hypothetical protein ES708_05181 [subsurface metagenome]